MTRCEATREALSDHLEGALPPETEDRIVAHLSTCRACDRLCAALAEVLDELPLLREAVPAGLADRVARTPLVPVLAAVRSARRLALQRAAAWGFVFLGAWWQLFGGAATSFAVQEVVPAASEVVVTAKHALARETARRGVLSEDATHRAREVAEPGNDAPLQETRP